MSAAATLRDGFGPEVHSPDSRPTRAYSAQVLRQLAVATSIWEPRPEGSAYHEQACQLAERLEQEALRHAKVLAILDLRRSRALREAAAVARSASKRFRLWMTWDVPLVQKQLDLSLWSDALRSACALGIDPTAPAA